jgi:nucleotide-binding universal stress UspA family protein
MPTAETSPGPIVIAYDGSSQAQAAIAEAARLFPDHRAVVVSAWRSIADVVPAALIAVPASVAREGAVKMDDASRAEAQALADAGADLAQGAGLEARGEAIEATGALWPSIVQAGEDNDAAAVVVGSRGLSGVKSAVLGSVSAGVVHHCKRPVLVVR